MSDSMLVQARYLAAPGERNRIAVSASTVTKFTMLLPGDVQGMALGTAYTFSDSGAVVTPGDHCTAIDQHTVQCLPPPYPEPASGFQSLGASIDAGDLDDEVSSSSTADNVAASLVVHGGLGADRISLSFGPSVGSAQYGDEGNDVLRSGGSGGTLDGGPGDDELMGGDGSDYLVGGGGADVLDAGGGDDSLVDGDADGAAGAHGRGPDVLEGGPGEDYLSYAARTVAVHVDLAGHAGGEAGEGDVLSGIENVVGGRGDDRLAGDGAANLLYGGRGRDRLIGHGGNDTLDPGYVGRLPAGAGSISCGPGRDIIPTGAISPNELTADCEHVSLARSASPQSPVFTASPRAANAQSLRYRLRCPRNEIDGEAGNTTACSLRMRIRESSGRRRLLASGAIPRGPWHHRPLDARLTTLGQRLAARGHRVRATVTLKLHVDYFEGPTVVILRWIARV